MQQIEVDLPSVLMCIGNQTLQIWQLQHQLAAIQEVVERTLKRKEENHASVEGKEQENGQCEHPHAPQGGLPTQTGRRRRHAKGGQAEEEVTVVPGPSQAGAPLLGPEDNCNGAPQADGLAP